MDPRNVLALWDNIRYKVRPSRPVWVLDRKKVYEGVPALDNIQAMIDAQFAAKI